MLITEPIRILMADDHEIYRDGLRMMLKNLPEMELVDEADNGQKLIQLAEKWKPDIILMDIVMPVKDGITATAYLTEHYPMINVIALSMFNEDNLIVDMLEAGAKGYLLKNADKKEILEAIKSVYRHVPYYCRSTSTKLAQLIARSRYNPYTKSEHLVFTDKEIQIMRLVCEELTNKEIGAKLFISDRTVEGIRLRLQEKLNVKSTTGIVIYAIKHGIYSP